MIVFIIVISIYVLFIVWVLAGVINYPGLREITGENKQKFSIIIPFKNEERFLSSLLKSLKRLNYNPQYYEVIFVDDHSIDKSVRVIQELADSNMQIILSSGNSSKKAALLTGIRRAEYPWIVTTDADCEVPENWLQVFDTIIAQNEVKMILGPVKFKDKTGFLQQLQQVEFMALQALSLSGVYWKKPFLSNGANLCFDKNTFFELGAYEGNMQIMSGDDVFLLEKFQRKYPDQIYYAKTTRALVSTRYQEEIAGLIQQKIRWAGKIKHFHSFWAFVAGLLILFTNILLIPALIVGIMGDINFLIFPVIKLLADLILLIYTRKFIPFRLNFLYFIVVFILYPFYYVYVSLLSIKGVYIWKDKKFKA